MFAMGLVPDGCDGRSCSRGFRAGRQLGLSLMSETVAHSKSKRFDFGRFIHGFCLRMVGEKMAVVVLGQV